MEMAEATATVVQHVFARLVREGMLPRALFENLASAHEQMADETLIEGKAASARAVADVARLILVLSEGGITKPILRVVDGDAVDGND